MYEIKAQMFDVTGQPVGQEFLVNTTTSGWQSLPSISSVSGGGFVVVWQDSSSGTADIRGQLYSSVGQPIGGQLLVNTTTSGFEVDPTMTGLTTSGFVVSWVDKNLFTSDIQARFYSSIGQPVSGEILINTTTNGPQYAPSVVALDGGGAAFTWADTSFSTSDIRFQAYNSFGGRIGTELLVTNQSVM